MSTVEMKAQIHEYLNQVDDDFVEAIHAMLDTYIAKQKDTILGYDVHGNPKYAAVMKEKYKEDLKAVKQGKGKSLKEMKAKHGIKTLKS